MSNDISQQGFGNIALQGIENSAISITLQLGKSTQYKELLEQLNTQKELLSLIPESNLEKRQACSQKIAELEIFVEKFKQDVLQLAETFNRIEIFTERLSRAKEHFDKGNFNEARTVLESELEQIRNEQSQLLSKRQIYEQEILPKLKHNSEEFLILAFTTLLNYDNPHRFEQASEYFESSINTYETLENCFNYAVFLYDHNKFDKSISYLEMILERFSSELSFVDYSVILNSLGNLYKRTNRFDDSEQNLKNALEVLQSQDNSKKYIYVLANIALVKNSLGTLFGEQWRYDESQIELSEAEELWRKINDDEDGEYEGFLAMTLNNYGVTLKELEEYEKSREKLIEALKLRRDLANKYPDLYEPDLLSTLGNLSNLETQLFNDNKAIEYQIEAVKLSRKLAESNPRMFLEKLALALMSLGNKYTDNKEFSESEKNYIEALEIYVRLVDEYKQFDAVAYAQLLRVAAKFYLMSLPNKEESLTYAKEAYIYAIPYAEVNPNADKTCFMAIRILKEWGMSIDEIMDFFEDRIEEKN